MKNTLLLMLALALLILLAIPGKINAADNSFSIVSKNSLRCLDVASGSTADGANVQQFACHGGGNQKWRLRGFIGGPYEIINIYSGKCLDVINGSLTDGANVQQFTCHQGDNQQWNLISYGSYNGRTIYLVVNKHSGKCLDVANASAINGANVQQFTCHRGNNQQWYGFNFIDTV